MCSWHSDDRVWCIVAGVAGVGVLDWNSWGAVEEAGYLYGKEQMRKWKAELIRTNDPRGEIFK